MTHHFECHFLLSLKLTPVGAESSWGNILHLSKFIPPKIKWFKQRLEQIKDRVGWHKILLLFNQIYRFIVSKRSYPYQERRTITENLCCGNTQPLLIKLEKLIQLLVLISVWVRSFKGKRYMTNLKSGWGL